MSNFKIIAKDGNARAGILKTAHGDIQTPVFMPVGTQGSVKALSPDDLKGSGSQIILGNTYHLYLRPGNKLIKKMGGLHKFMNWDGPILTDSGGFQAFSLGAMIEHGVKKIQNSKVKNGGEGKILKQVEKAPLRDHDDTMGHDIVNDSYRKIPENREKSRENSRGERGVLSRVTDVGVEFKSHLDGSKHLLTPEKSIQIQLDLGSDIVLVLDELLSPLHDRDYVEKSLERTHKWELESQKYFKKMSQKSTNPSPLLFGILQGVYNKKIREDEARWVNKQGFDGISIGGSFGTSEIWGNDSVNWAAEKAINDTFDWVTPLLPEDLPRHGLGIGEVANLFGSIERGIDMFDCVSPTRRARNGSLYISPKNGGKVANKFVLSIQKTEYKDDKKSIDPGCECYTCQSFSRSYLRHLFVSSEILYHRLASIHNVYFINNMVGQIRKAILDKQFIKLRHKWLV